MLMGMGVGVDINAKVDEARQDDNAILLDVRTREEYNAGHIEGAVCIPLDQISKAARLYGNKSLYVYCASGSRSAQAVSMLKQAGVQQVENIGGIGGYRGTVVRG
ncbi:MAG: rhodanese-like domain-containing protein [Atopobiaceae bacterium]|nr:rhodanese-like domain-containing protein [Atopobiaceae bacterium]